MDEARRVLDRLERIEELRGTGAAPSVLLSELRALVREGERWAGAERGGTRAARVALDALDTRLSSCGERTGETVAGRGVVAGGGG